MIFGASEFGVQSAKLWRIEYTSRFTRAACLKQNAAPNLLCMGRTAADNSFSTVVALDI